MRTNNLRTIWKTGGAAVNGWLAIPNSFSAETMAHQGWDTLTIDLQHGVVDYQAMVTMLQAISTTPTVPVVRVPWLEPGILMKALDAGAYAVICPMVSTREEAQKLVAWTTYAPKGTRSFGPVRALYYGGADYPAHADQTVVRFAMIETAARHHGVVAGIHNAGPASALRRIGMGFQFVTVSSDAKLIAEGSQQIMAAMRAGRSASQAKPSSGY